MENIFKQITEQVSKFIDNPYQYSKETFVYLRESCQEYGQYLYDWKFIFQTSKEKCVIEHVELEY